MLSCRTLITSWRRWTWMFSLPIQQWRKQRGKIGRNQSTKRRTSLCHDVKRPHWPFMSRHMSKIQVIFATIKMSEVIAMFYNSNPFSDFIECFSTSKYTEYRISQYNVIANRTLLTKSPLTMEDANVVPKTTIINPNMVLEGSKQWKNIIPFELSNLVPQPWHLKR